MQKVEYQLQEFEAIFPQMLNESNISDNGMEIVADYFATKKKPSKVCPPRSFYSQTQPTELSSFYPSKINPFLCKLASILSFPAFITCTEYCDECAKV